MAVRALLLLVIIVGAGIAFLPERLDLFLWIALGLPGVFFVVLLAKWLARRRPR